MQTSSKSAFLFQGLLCARAYFGSDTPVEKRLRDRIGYLWAEAEWDWHTQGGRRALTWHWSPNNGFALNHPVRGWNECLIAYILAASAPRYSVPAEVYHEGWAQGREFVNRRTFEAVELPLGPDWGGPLFFTQYSFSVVDPRGLSDNYADYWAQNVSHTRINHAYCLRNPHGYKGYGPNCWGLTAGRLGARLRGTCSRQRCRRHHAKRGLVELHLRARGGDGRVAPFL